MDMSADRKIIASFVLGILVCAAVLSPLWLSSGISKEDASFIVAEKIYSDLGREDFYVETTDVKEGGDGIYSVDVLIRSFASSSNMTYLVTRDGTIILDESEEIDGQAEEETPEEDTVATSSGRTVDGVHIKGPDDAKVTIIEYSDFECPFCKRYYDNAYKQILSTYPDDVKMIFKDFPLSFHAQATPAAEAAECAGAQEWFWEYHDILFERQSEWASSGRPAFNSYAEELGLDMDAFNNCVDSRQFRENVVADFQEGQAAGVRGTPAFFINGKMVSGAQPFSAFQTEIDAALAASG
jgi:protein-disulfide isomerase